MSETILDTISGTKTREAVLFSTKYIETDSVMVPYKRNIRDFCLSTLMGIIASLPVTSIGAIAIASDFHAIPVTFAAASVLGSHFGIRYCIRAESLETRIPKINGGLDKDDTSKVLKAARKRSRKKNPGQTLEVESNYDYKRYRLTFLEKGIKVDYLKPVNPKKDWDLKLEMVKSAYNIETPPNPAKKLKKKKKELEDV